MATKKQIEAAKQRKIFEQEKQKEFEAMAEKFGQVYGELKTLRAFLETIENVLLANTKVEYVVRNSYDTMGERKERDSIEKRILKGVLALKIDFEREDESSAIESEKSDMLFNIVMASIKDEARLKEIDVEKEMVLAGCVKVFHHESGKFSWQKPQK